MPAFKKRKGEKGERNGEKRKKKAVENNVSGYGYRTDER